MKHDYGFKRFLTKGIKNIDNELRIMMFAVNINKLYTKIIRTDFD